MSLTRSFLAPALSSSASVSLSPTSSKTLADRGSENRAGVASFLTGALPIVIDADGAEVDSSTAASFLYKGGELEIMRATLLIAFPTIELERRRTCSGDVPKLRGLDRP